MLAASPPSASSDILAVGKASTERGEIGQRIHAEEQPRRVTEREQL
jgi:hypothetical protein